MTKFYEVPGYPRYEINISGDLFDRKTGKQKTWYVQDPIDEMGGRIRNMKRGYLIARVISEDGIKRHVFQHRILATLFVDCPGNPDDYIVNHKDGDGGNNVINNLEWVTYSENMIHAYANGLCGNVNPVQVKEFHSGDVIEYRSVAECARAVGIPAPTLINRLKSNPGKRYEDGFSYRYADEPVEWSDVLVKTIKPKCVFAVDVVDKILHVAENQKELATILGLTESNVNATLRRGSLLPVGRFVIGWDGATKSIPQFTDKQIELFKLPRKRADQSGWIELDIVTGLKQMYLLDQLAAKYGKKQSDILTQLKSGMSKCGRYKYENVKPFPENYSPLPE